MIEDDERLARMVAEYLAPHGFEVVRAATAGRGLALAERGGLAAVLLDVMLPDLDGFAVCRRLREREVWTPVLMLTARDAVEDRVAGLDAGADDYLAKPFAFDELLARLRALARRAPNERPTMLTVGELRLDPAARRVWRADAELDLSGKEFALLELFLRNAGSVLSRDQLLDGGWDMSFERRSNVIDVYVRNLGAKVGRDTIETVRGVGYRLRRDGGT
jgi:two-component system OmpR family response regulator